MAYNTTNIINYYDDTSIIKTSYAANISGQIQRIEDAHKAIRSKAIELGLTIPAQKRLTSNASGLSELALADTHHILDTAAAINNIPINSHNSLTIKAGSSYTVPIGYNAVAYTITASGLEDQTSGDATAIDILKGKTAWVNGSKVTGTMLNKSGNLTASSSNYYESSNTKYLYLTIPETGKYTKDSLLQSDIRYYDSGSIEIPVTITIGSTGETIASTSQFFPEGYYSGGVNIKAVYDGTTTNKVINIDNAVGQLNAQSGKLTITSGYDYFAADASYSVKTGSISAVTKSVDPATGVITFDGGETTAGWISADVTKPTTYTPTKAVFSTNNTTGKVTVTTAGWVTKDTEIGGLTAGSATMTGPTLASSATTVGGVSIASGAYYMKLSKTAGYITSGTVGINLGRAVVTNSTSTGTATATINTQKWQVVTSAGYNPSPITTVLTVKSGSISNASVDSNYNCKVTITEGWVPNTTITFAGTAQEYIVTGTENPSSYIVEAATGTLMKSLKINTASIYAKLAAI